MKPYLTRAVAAALAGANLIGSTSARDLPTTYGEDPVPETYLSLQPPYTAYGMDPIPVVSPMERWLEWRAYREEKKKMRERQPSYRAGSGWRDLLRWR